MVPVEQELPAAADVERVIGAVKRHKLQRLHDAVYGSMIAVEHLYQGHFDRYGALYVELPRLSTQKGLHIRPAGRYLRAFCKGPWDNLPGCYEEILAYAGAHGLKLYGYSYETGSMRASSTALTNTSLRSRSPSKSRAPDITKRGAAAGYWILRLLWR